MVRTMYSLLIKTSKIEVLDTGLFWEVLWAPLKLDAIGLLCCLNKMCKFDCTDFGLSLLHLRTLFVFLLQGESLPTCEAFLSGA